MRRRVLFIINSLAGGGAERVMATLLAHSAPWHGRYEIALALLDDEPRAYAVPEGITVHQFASRGSLARATFALRRLLSDWRPDVALSFLTRANVAAWLARRHAMPLVISERVNTSAHLSHGLAGQLSRRMVALAYPRADHLIAVSHGVADDLAANFGVDRGKVTVLSNPVDLASIEASAAAAPEIEIEGPYVVAAGRLVENKNFALLIDAFVDAQMPGKLVIIGEGPLRADLEQRARDRGAADRIVLAGFVANPFPILANADLFVNDAFSAAHRAHATTEGLTHLLPSYAGRAMQTELEALEKALGNPQKPVAAVVGGAKVSTKLAVLKHLVDKVDHLIIGGGMANTFLAARGVDVGKSLCEHDLAATAEEIMDAADSAGCTVHLPYDVVVAKEFAANPPSMRICNVHEVAADEMILDVGPQAVESLGDVLKTCRTLVWNGPLGAFETQPFDAATVALARTAAALSKEGSLVSVAGGGDTVAALNHAGVAGDFTYISTAGGAFLEWMEGRVLPGVAALEG